MGPSSTRGAGGIAGLVAAEPWDPILGLEVGEEIPAGAIVLDDVPVQASAGYPVGGQELSQPAPCANADPTKLVVLPDPVQLNPGAKKGSFVIYDCGKNNIGWTACLPARRAAARQAAAPRRGWPPCRAGRTSAWR